VLIWIAGKAAGIYAIAQVLRSPQFMPEPPDIEIWTMPVRAMGRFYSPVCFTQKFLEQPLCKIELSRDRILHDLEVIRWPRNTNFRVSHAQWQRVQEIRALTGD
jgi:hypothetical protein